MEETRPKWKILSGSWLKIIAMLTMLIDHSLKSVLVGNKAFFTPFVSLFGLNISMALIASILGRISFPLYCFFLTEGFIHTKNRKKYGRNLLLFALISELPWNFFFSGELLYAKQNVFFTLFLGYLILCALDRIEKKPLQSTVCILIIVAFSVVLRADYGYVGLAIIIALYVLRRIAVARAVVCIGLFSSGWRAGLAFIPITLYNGERGFIKGRFGKYVCYAFYPIHLLVLGLINHLVI